MIAEQKDKLMCYQQTVAIFGKKKKNNNHFSMMP